jgi:hypothetical protein
MFDKHGITATALPEIDTSPNRGIGVEIAVITVLRGANATLTVDVPAGLGVPVV